MKLTTHRIMATIEQYPSKILPLRGVTHGKVFTINISYQIADWSCNFKSIQYSAFSVDKFITLKPLHAQFIFFSIWSYKHLSFISGKQSLFNLVIIIIVKV